LVLFLIWHIINHKQGIENYSFFLNFTAPISELNQLLKFDVVIMSDDDVGVRKPHKEIFKKAILQLDANLDPLSTAFISDDIDINHFKVYIYYLSKT
jgi:hypothetical protein